GPAGGPGRGAGFPFRCLWAPRAARGGPAGGPGHAAGPRRWGALPRGRRVPLRASRGGTEGFSRPALARACRRGQRRSAAGPPLRRGAAGWSLAAAAGAAERRPRLSAPVPEFARAWLLREPRACGREGVPARPPPGGALASRSPGAGPPSLSPTPSLLSDARARVARSAGTAASPPSPRFPPPLAPAAGRRPSPGTGPASPDSGPLPGSVRARPPGRRGAPPVRARAAARGKGGPPARGVTSPAGRARSGRRRKRRAAARTGQQGASGARGGGSSGVAGGVSCDPACTVSGCCGAARPAAQGKGLRAFRAGARRRVGAVAPRRAASRASGRPEPRLSSRAQRRATEGNPGPREGGRGGGGGCRARPRGRTLPRGRQRGRHPRGACRSFPSPQGQVPSVRVSAALPRRARGSKAVEPGGGLKTRAARRDPGGGRAAVPLRGREFLPRRALVGCRLCSSRGQPCRGGVPLPPPLRGPVSVETAVRSAVAGLPASKRATPA
ncbi:uncharacterized protein ACIBXB_009569, partial [Morphnus guianensis]